MEKQKSATPNSTQVAQAAIRMAISESREAERELKHIQSQQHINVAGVNFGGEAVSSVAKIIEHAVVGAKREGLIKEAHAEEGAIAGATHEALCQVMNRSIGLNFGGKIGIARGGQHLCVAVFLSIGMIHLDDVAIALAHRAMEEKA